MLVLTAIAAALVLPAVVSAAGAGQAQLTPSVALPSANSSGPMGGESPDIFLVELADGAETFRKQAKAVGLKYTQRFAYKSLFKGVSVRIDRNDVGKLAGIASVSRVYPARYYTLGPEPTADPDLATAIQMTGADIAQAEGHTGAGVKVAVMDTGIDVDHPDLGGDGNAAAPHPFPNSRVAGGWDFVGDDYNADPESPGYDPVPQPDPLPDDCNGHGTHVAGIVGADKASGAGGALGVAPDVTFGAYRVFGCDGSVTDDVMIAAMERIQADGMDVLNMSIGDAFNNWAGTPTAAAADALVDAGVVVVASIGNSGANGIYSAGAPGVGDKVIGVASYDNSHVQAPGFTISPDNAPIAYIDSVSTIPGIPDPPNPPTSGTVAIAESPAADLIGAVPPGALPANDGCAPFPAGHFTGKVALIRRGTCTFTVKAQNAEAAGAVAVVLYNNQPGSVGPRVEATPQVAIPVVMILQQSGELIHNRLVTAPVSLTWQVSVTAVNPTGGLISGFSSYGTEAELNVKPDIGAPGGLIRSTWPLEDGAYATISGTSMASPHVAGAVALLKEAHPSLPAPAFRAVLQNSADPTVWSLNSGLGLLDNVHRQGAGMVDIDDAINATTSIVPGKLSLGESQAGPVTRTLTVTNNSSTSVTYDLFNVDAIGTTGTFPADVEFWLTETQVAFSAPSVTVPAHGSATVNVTLTVDPRVGDTPPLFLGIPNGGLYGGYLVFQDQDNLDSVFSVPYAGFKGDYQSIVAIPTAPVIGKLNGPPFSKAQQTYAQAAAGHRWTLQSPDEIPNVLIHFDHQVRHLELQVVNAATGSPVHPVFSNIVERDFVARNGLRPPVGGPFNTDAINDDVTAFPWDGTRMHDNGGGTPDHRKVVPDGSYKIVVKALKAGGDPKNPAHWEIWTTP
ncbi:MAG TPA: S8 family serine peptidase, partial [Gaiellaceae bacterium]|nr:S8 family serine peptidase [Gaiellaceae bacterium]